MPPTHAPRSLRWTGRIDRDRVCAEAVPSTRNCRASSGSVAAADGSAGGTAAGIVGTSCCTAAFHSGTCGARFSDDAGRTIEASPSDPDSMSVAATCLQADPTGHEQSEPTTTGGPALSVLNSMEHE